MDMSLLQKRVADLQASSQVTYVMSCNSMHQFEEA